MNSKVKKVAKGIIGFLKKEGIENILPELVFELGKEVKMLGSVCEITTPVKLNDAEKKKAIIAVSHLVGKSLKGKFLVDESLIDGMKVKFGDRVWDLSLSGSLGVLVKD